MDYFKKIERSVTISADKRSTVDLQVDVWSQDLNVTKFILKLDTTDSTAIDLTSASVRVAMVYNQDGTDVKIEAAGIVEDAATQKIAYVMDDKLAGFEGTVTAGFYVTLSTGQRIDIQNVTFNMRKSLLDKDLEAAKESYYKTFDDIVADVQSEGENAKKQINAVLPTIQSQVSELDRQIKALPQIPDLFVAYANSPDGSVDFSRVKPEENLLSNGDFSKGFTNANIANGDKNVGTVEFVNFKGKQCIKLTDVDFWNISKYARLVIGNQNRKARTLEFDVLLQKGSLIVNDGVEDYVISSVNSDFVRYKKKIPITYNRDYIAFYGNRTPVTCYITNFALHDGDVEIQPFLPSRVDDYRDSFMKYIGHSVKNSINSSDYRWQVNPEWQRAQLDYGKASMIQDKLVNLITNADFSQGSTGWTAVNSTLSVDNGMLKIIGDGTSSSVRAYCGIGFANTNDVIYMKCDYSTIKGSQTPLSSAIQLRSADLTIDNTISYDFKDNTLSGVYKATKSYQHVFYVLQTYNSPSNASGNGFKIDNVVAYNLTSIFGAGNEPSLEEFERLLAINVNSPTIYSQSISKAELNANPINSILTTLSQENPSTTLGGTWTQLGTESKFDNTIYYWKRTN